MVKNLRFSALAILAIALGFSSCSKEDGVLEAGGAKTNASIALSFPVTRAVVSGEGAATDSEIAISKIDLFIYSESSKVLTSYVSLSAADFTKSAEGVYKNNDPIPATTGAKIIVAMANISDELRNELVQVDEDNKIISAKSYTQASAAMSINPEADMNGTYLPMVSDATPAILVASVTGDDNEISLSLRRLTAKFIAEESSDMNKKPEDEEFPGQMGDVFFSVGNMNKKTFLIQKSDFKDPNWNQSEYPALGMNPSDEDKQKNEAYKNDNFVDLSTWLQTSVYAADVKDAKGYYTSENTSEGKRLKDVTRVDVMSTFMPDKITTYFNDTDWSNGGKYIESNGTLGTTFYTVTPDLELGKHYFLDLEMAKSFAEHYGLDITPETDGTIKSIKEFTDGKCYWVIYPNKLGEGADTGGVASDRYKWDVIRNNIYRCKIKSITYPGSNQRGGDKDPDTKPEEETLISVDIKVENWLYVIDEEVDLAS